MTRLSSTDYDEQDVVDIDEVVEVDEVAVEAALEKRRQQ
jgi:hypothetical protein